MTALKYVPPVHIHPVMILFILLAFVTGTFEHLLVIFGIVFIHELGHYMMASFFRWRINGIIFFLFGGVMDTDEHMTRPLYEEVLVAVSGPFFHVFIFIGCYLFQMTDMGIMSAGIVDDILFYNTVILIFNLLPIWPLDGGKLFFLTLCRLYPYKRSHIIMIICSIVIVVLLVSAYFFVESFSLGVLALAIFLLLENRAEWKRHTYLFIRFLLNKYEHSSRIDRVVPIVVPSYWTLMDVFARFKREAAHHIYIEFPDHSRKMVHDMECLYSYFHDKRHGKQMADMVHYIG